MFVWQSRNKTSEKKGDHHMATITTKDETQIYYKDWGKGQPIVFSHGWPLSADDWDTQMMFFLNHGYRVIAHDRRGHGRSSQPGGGHDMDHYADEPSYRRSEPESSNYASSIAGDCGSPRHGRLGALARVLS